MDRELALAFEFENAPQDVKDKGKAHQENWLRLEKAKQQIQLWGAELEAARKDYSKTSEAFKRALKTWDPADLKNKDLIDAPEKAKDPKAPKTEAT